jgi:hypothetical protein
MDHEVVIYIHGISPDEKLATFADERKVERLTDQVRQRKIEISHQSEYEKLKNGISRFIRDESRQKAWNQVDYCFTEWGWEFQETDAQNLGAGHRLKDAQHQLGQRVIQAIKDSYWITLIPQQSIRKLALYGLSDVFYYVSSDGGHSIKRRICHQIASRLRDVLDDPSAQVSLTLIGHSAGSVIALDLLPFLDELSMEELIEQKTGLDKEISVAQKQRKQEGGGYRKIDAVFDDSRDVIDSLMRLKSLKDDRRLTLKRLITMGSPVAMMALRRDQRIRDLAYDGNRVSLASLGFADAGDAIDNPRWVNIWNKYDPISFPVEPMVEESSSVKDFHLKVAWNPLKSHTNYWNSKNVHRLLAELW